MKRTWLLLFLLAFLMVGCGSGKERNKNKYLDRPTTADDKAK